MTPRQAQTLGFIRSYIAEHDGVSPSYEEIAAHLGVKSKSIVNRTVRCLVERGLLRHEGGKNRALVPVDPRAESDDYRRGFADGQNAALASSPDTPPVSSSGAGVTGGPRERSRSAAFHHPV